MVKRFNGLYYLDVPKTGSTRITTLLADLILGGCLGGISHRPLPKNYDRKPLRVLSIRQADAHYLSLFRFGCDGRGRLASYLQQMGAGLRYEPTVEAFNTWLSFVLNPKNADRIGWGYDRGSIADLMGYSTYLILRMALPQGADRLAHVESRTDIRLRLEQKMLRPHALIRTEHLEADLKMTLAKYADRLPLRVSLDQLSDTLSARVRQNHSRSGAHLSVEDIHTDIRAEITERDWLHISDFIIR